MTERLQTSWSSQVAHRMHIRWKVLHGRAHGGPARRWTAGDYYNPTSRSVTPPFVRASTLNILVPYFRTLPTVRLNTHHPRALMSAVVGII